MAGSIKAPAAELRAGEQVGASDPASCWYSRQRHSKETAHPPKSARWLGCSLGCNEVGSSVPARVLGNPAPIWHYNNTAKQYNGQFDQSMTDTGKYGSFTIKHTWPKGSAYQDCFVIGDPSFDARRAPKDGSKGHT